MANEVAMMPDLHPIEKVTSPRTPPAKIQDDKPVLTVTTSIVSPSSGSNDSSPGSSDAASTAPSGCSSSTARSTTLNPLAQDFKKAAISPLPLQPPPAAGKLYELRKVPGKGFGLFSTGFIALGTRIICEPPLLTIHNNSPRFALGAYCNLSDAQKVVFDKLHGFAPNDLRLEQVSRTCLIDPSDRNMDEDDIEDAVAEHVRVTSIFACNNFKMGDRVGVFETTSRLNHSCVPNVHHSYNPTLKKQTVHATRNIAPGEELCTTYIGGSGDYYVRAQRIDMLQSSYGFICHCPACTDITGTSDGRRELLGHVAWGLQQYLEGTGQGTRFTPTSPAAALLQAQDLSAMLIDEGLFSTELMKAYRTASKQALLAKNYSVALDLARKELEVQRNILGDEVADLKKLGADANVWIEDVRATMKAAGVSVNAPNESTDQTRKAKPQKSSKRKKQENKRKVSENKKAEGTTERLAQRDKSRAAEGEKTEGGNAVDTVDADRKAENLSTSK